MKKIFVLATAALMFTSVAFASLGDGDKGKNKKCGKSKSCCSKGTPATKAPSIKASKTVKM